VYSRSGCGNCHRIGNTGSIYGPELTRIGAGRSLEYLRESILDPSADIADNYAGVTVVTQEGRRISGVRINEDTFTVQIRKPDQAFGLFDKSQIKEVIHETKSMMPAYKSLSATDFQNLLAYLETLRGQLEGNLLDMSGLQRHVDRDGTAKLVSPTQHKGSDDEILTLAHIAHPMPVMRATPSAACAATCSCRTSMSWMPSSRAPL